MPKLSRLKSFFVALAFVGFVAIGFISVNTMTSCTSNAQSICVTCGASCTLPGAGLGAGYLELMGIVVGDIGIVASLMATYMGTALAAFTDAIAQKILEVTNNITQWIDTFWWYNLRPALQAMTDQLNTFDTFQDLNAGGEQDSGDNMRLDDELLKRDMDSHREQAPSENVCVAGTVSSSMTRLDVFRRAYESAATQERRQRSAGDKAGAPAAYPDAYLGPEADQQWRWDTYKTKYCNQDFNAGYSACAASVAPLQVDRDLRVTDEIFMKDTIDLVDQPTREAVDDMIMNIAEPRIKDPVPASALDTAEGQEAFLRGQAYKAKRQAVFDALYYIVSRRAPGSRNVSGGATDQPGDFIEAIRKQAGYPPTSGYLSSNATSGKSSPSHNEIMEVMMSERYRNGQYSIDQVDEPENNDRELVVQQAFQAMLLSDQLDLLDRYGLILAAQTSSEIRKYKQVDNELEASGVR